MKTQLFKPSWFLLSGLLLSFLVGCDRINFGNEKETATEQSKVSESSASQSEDSSEQEDGVQKETDDSQQKNQGADEKGAAPEVAVISVQPQTLVMTENLPARLEASREAVVRARVNGIVEKRLFTEGTMVKANELLYQIDDAPYQADLSTAKAKRQQAEANKQLAQSTMNRYKPLVQQQAISHLQYDQAKSEVLVAQANIKAAEAAIKQAQINVDYAHVTAPISGFIGKSFVTEGALVSAAQATEMARIQQLDPMYVNISQSAIDIMSLRKAIDSGALSNTNGQTEVEVTFEDGTSYPYKGKLLFTDQTVEESTGELLVRAEIPNPNNDLLPGLYVRVNMPLAAYDNAYLIPQQAVTRGSNNKDSVIVVNEDGSFAPKTIKVATGQDTNWIVTDGLQPGDKVLVEGQMHLRGVKKVTPVPWEKDNNS